MLTDPDLFSYIYDTIKYESIDDLSGSITKAIKEYNSDRDYVTECNHRLVVLSSPKQKLECNNYAITKQEYESSNFCGSKDYETKTGFDCCSVHVSGNNDLGNSFDEYFCYHMKNNKDYKNFVQELISSDYELHHSYANIKIEFDCISSYISTYMNLLIILFILLNN